MPNSPFAILVPIYFLLAWICVTGLLVRIAGEKRTVIDPAILWIVGIFASPMVLWMLVIAHPDRRPQTRTTQTAGTPNPKPTTQESPAVEYGQDLHVDKTPQTEMSGTGGLEKRKNKNTGLSWKVVLIAFAAVLVLWIVMTLISLISGR